MANNNEDVGFKETVYRSKHGPTKLVQYGLDSLITEDNVNLFANTRRVIYVIPGNPGVITFYKYFMAQLHQKEGCPVIGFSHVGHIPDEIDTIQCETTLWYQIYHHLELIETLIPPHVEIILAGHSIGAFIALQLNRLVTKRSRIIKSFLLFPALQKMGDLPAAKSFKVLFMFKHFVFFIIFLLSSLSRATQDRIRGWFARSNHEMNPQCARDGVLELVNWKVLKHVVSMAQDEFRQVYHLDERLIEENLDKLVSVFAEVDRWAPVEHAVIMKKLFPEGQIEMLNKVPHDFVMRTDHTDIVVDFMLDRIK